MPYVYFDSRHTPAILFRLSSAGYEFIRADLLVRMACGYLPHDLGVEEQLLLIESAEQHRLNSMIAPAD